jgi:hypothetical protein
MKIRAKFKCFSVELFEHTEIAKFSAINGGKEDNKQWSDATPSGRLEMTLSNAASHGHFGPGKSYYLDIIEATE